MKRIGLFAAILIAIGIVASEAGSARATTFSPTYAATLSSSAPGASSNITVDFDIDSPDTLERVHVSFIPSEFGVADDASVPDGARVGSVSATSAESHSNGGCNNTPFLAADLFEATADTGNILADNPRIPDPGWPGFADADTNNLVDSIDRYPNFLNNLYPGVTPRARSIGFVDSGVGFINRVFNVLVFDPGETLPGVGTLDPALGFPVVVVLQDPTAPPATSLVTDRCSDFSYLRFERGTTLDNLGTAADESGFSYRTNPATDATVTFVDYSQTDRDQDDDGIENRLDTCPYDPTPDWDPRISDPVNDPDDDGIPGRDDVSQMGEQLLAGSGCDTTPLTANSDDDADGMLNREDNCVLVANGIALDNQADADDDGIGDACDVVAAIPDGHLHESCATQNVDIGLGGSPPTLTCPSAFADQDSDGFTDDEEAHIGTDPGDPCGTSEWPLDIISGEVPDSTDKVNIVDLQSYILPVRRLGTSPGDANFDVRWDVEPGPGGPFAVHINVADLQRMAFTYPPMLEGARAFNGPLCPWAGY